MPRVGTRAEDGLRGDQAVAHMSSFAVGIGLFILVIALVLGSALQLVPPTPMHPGDPDGRLAAEAVLTALLAPGTDSAIDPGGWDAAKASWTPAAQPRDARVGFGHPVDPDALRNLLRAQKTAQAADSLDLDEMRESLGLEPAVYGSPEGVERRTLHLRLLPRLPSLEATGGAPNVPLDVWYIPAADPGVAGEEESVLTGLLQTPPTVSATGPTPCVGGVATHHVLVLGSGGSWPATVTPSDVADFVRDCAGTVVLLGGTDCACLPTGALPDPAGGPVQTGDAGQGVLQRPNAPALTAYATQGGVVLPEPEAYHVVARSSGQAVLQASLPGAYGPGVILILSALPTRAWDGSTTDAQEGARILHNLLIQHYTHLFVDYGDTVPVSARPAVGTALVDHSLSVGIAAPQETVVVDVLVWVAPRA